MDVEMVRAYCLAKKEVTEGFPFGNDTLVFKVAGKMFLLFRLAPPQRMNLKCKPEDCIDLRERYESVTPGYHMDKKHWVTIELDGTISRGMLEELIDNSYNLIVDKLPKKLKEKIRD